jgi:hypothetical protein
MVEAREREPLAWFLRKIARGLTNQGKATLLSWSSEDFREIEAANRRREVTPRPACSAQS